MKILLSLSFILNIFLGYKLLTQKPEKEIVERLIIETHAPQKGGNQNTQDVSAKPKKMKRSDSSSSSMDGSNFIPMDSYDFHDAGDKVETERMEFLTITLGIPEEKILKHQKIREEYFKKTAEFWRKHHEKDSSFEPSISERRKLLDMEEEFIKDLEKLYGKENWEKYQKFREKYNEKGFKNQSEENQPFLFMGL